MKIPSLLDPRTGKPVPADALVSLLSAEIEIARKSGHQLDSVDQLERFLADTGNTAAAVRRAQAHLNRLWMALETKDELFREVAMQMSLASGEAVSSSHQP